MDVCIFHSADLDGHCSAAIIKKEFPETVLIGTNYGKEFNFDVLSGMVDGDTLWIVDFSFSRYIMERLHKEYDVIWIDHHKTAIEDCAGLNIRGLQRIGDGACALTWEFVHYADMSARMPEIIRCLSEYDVGRQEDPHVVSVQYACRSCETYPAVSMDFWTAALGPGSSHISSDFIFTGSSIKRYVDKQNEAAKKSMIEEVMFEGHVFLAANMQGINLSFFSMFDPTKHYGVICYTRRHGKWYSTLFTSREDADMSKIAARFGGGGHKNAAGWNGFVPPRIELLTEEHSQ